PFDPRSRTLAGEAILGEVLPQLFRVDPAGREVGWLADDASVRVAPDGRSATFALRPGARWSDSAPITVDDVRFTLDTVRGAAWPGPAAGYDRVTVDGAGGSVTLRFDGPFPGWRRLFSGADFVLPAHRLAGKDLRKEWTSGPDVFGGPFRLGAVTPGLSVGLARNDSWWGPPAKAASIEVLVVPDVRTMEQLSAGASSTSPGRRRRPTGSGGSGPCPVSWCRWPNRGAPSRRWRPTPRRCLPTGASPTSGSPTATASSTSC